VAGPGGIAPLTRRQTRGGGVAVALRFVLDENQRGLLWRAMLRRGSRLSQVVQHLALVAHASEAWEWSDRIDFIP
jgi:hypothetical protein